MTYDTNNILLTGPGKQEATNVLEALAKHMQTKEQKINPMKIQVAATLVKLFWV